jgi:hypothetical protein
MSYYIITFQVQDVEILWIETRTTPSLFTVTRDLNETHLVLST